MIKRVFHILVFSVFATSCSFKKDLQQNVFKKENLLGTWSLNKWTMYHTLKIDENTIYVDNHIDSVFYLKYRIEKNLLITWSSQDSTKISKAEIIKNSNDSLIMKSFLNTPLLRYSRKE
jgi:hypothetical protein